MTNGRWAGEKPQWGSNGIRSMVKRRIEISGWKPARNRELVLKKKEHWRKVAEDHGLIGGD